MCTGVQTKVERAGPHDGNHLPPFFRDPVLARHKFWKDAHGDHGELGSCPKLPNSCPNLASGPMFGANSAANGRVGPVKFDQQLGNSDQTWSMLAKFGQLGETMSKFGRCFPSLGGRFWPNTVRLRQHWPILVEICRSFETCGQTLATFEPLWAKFGHMLVEIGSNVGQPRPIVAKFGPGFRVKLSTMFGQLFVNSSELAGICLGLSGSFGERLRIEGRDGARGHRCLEIPLR